MLPGCTPDEQADQAIEEPVLEPDAPEEGDPAADEAQPTPDQPEMAPDATEMDAEEDVSEAQIEGGLDIEVDLNRAYPEKAFGPLRTVLRAGNDQQKAEAREILERLMLNSNVMSTRSYAANVLTVSPAGSEEALSQAALNDPDKLVRRQAIDALSKASASPDLIAALRKAQGAEDPEIRSSALTAEMDVRLSSLENMTDTAWIARLLGRQKDDAAAQMQMKLVQKGNPVLPAVINVLQTASDADVRAGAATVIMCICAGTSPRQQEFAEVSQAIMKEGLQKPQPANLDGLKPLENALANDGSWKVRAVAAQGLGYLGQESSAPLLGDALHDEHEEVRWWAAQAMETVPSLGALDDLAEAANRDPSERVRAAAVRALGWVDSDEAVMPLIRATADRSSSVRQAAAEELARFQSPASLQALVVLFDDPSEDVRWAAVVAAGELRDEETVPALIEAMRDPSPMVANAAERALQRMGKAERRFGLESET
jgi:HEAT repeat protein